MAWMSNYILQNFMHAVTYPCPKYLNNTTTTTTNNNDNNDNNNNNNFTTYKAIDKGKMDIMPFILYYPELAVVVSVTIRMHVFGEIMYCTDTFHGTALNHLRTVCSDEFRCLHTDQWTAYKHTQPRCEPDLKLIRFAHMPHAILSSK